MGNEKPSTLQAQEHQEAMDLLRMAEATNNPAIAKIAASMAQERMRHRQSQAGKISPRLAVGLATVIGVAAVFGCGFALVHYPQAAGLEISGIIVAVSILLIGVYALFSGHLTQANFMIIFRWVAEHLKSKFSRDATTDVLSLKASTGKASDSQLPK